LVGARRQADHLASWRWEGGGASFTTAFFLGDSLRWSFTADFLWVVYGISVTAVCVQGERGIHYNVEISDYNGHFTGRNGIHDYGHFTGRMETHYKRILTLITTDTFTERGG
jgi:hypothetical protein